MSKIKKYANKLYIPVVLLLCILMLSLVVYAAFVGRGSAKGVLISSRRFFISNILQETAIPAGNTAAQMQDVADEFPYTVVTGVGGGTQSVIIRNNNAKGEMSMNDITYEISFWIADDDPNLTNGAYTYSVTGEDNIVHELNAANNYTYTYTDKTMTAATRTEHSYTVNWTETDNGLVESIPENAAEIFVLTHPTAPDNMTSTYLGSLLQLSEQVVTIREFQVTGEFDEPETTLRNESAFIYRVRTTGTPPTATTRLTIRYNSNKLNLVDYQTIEYDSAVAEVDGENEPTGYTIITTKPLAADSVYNFRFTRGTGWTEADENYADLCQFVTPDGNGFAHLTGNI